jgi:hypothetical protein
MNVARLRIGELLAGIGGIGLLVTMFLDWFGLESGKAIKLTGQGVSGAVSINPQFAARFAQSGWDGLGWFAILLVLIAAGAAITLVVATLVREPVAWAVGAAVMTTFAGLFAFGAVAISLLTQPDLGYGLPNQLVSVKGAAYVGLLLAALIPVGGWVTLADERTEAAYSAPPDVEARPAPPATAPPAAAPPAAP